MKIGFVILHYQNIDVTYECINYLQKLKDFSNHNIIVVDNCSPNKSGYVLKSKYKNQKNIKVIINENNLGFAEGNNIGYIYAKNELKCNAIVVMNSDIFIKNDDFILSLKNEIKKKGDIIAPGVWVVEKELYQNPLSVKEFSLNDVMKKRKNVKRILFLLKIPLINMVLLKILAIKQKKRDKDRRKIVESYDKNNELYNIIPHGCCVIFCNDWIKKENFAFVPGTFMFYEEYLLYYYCKKNNYIIRFDPSIEVDHMASSSTKIINKNEIRRKKFFYKNELESINVLINNMKNDL